MHLTRRERMQLVRISRCYWKKLVIFTFSRKRPSSAATILHKNDWVSGVLAAKS